MNVFVCPGSFLFKDFEKAMSGLEDVNITGILTSEDSEGAEWGSGRTGFETWTKNNLTKLDPDLNRTPFHDRYQDVLSIILKDPRAYYLMERVFSTGLFQGYNSVFNHTVKTEIAIWNSLSILYQTKPDRIVVPSTPHSITWFFVRTAELIGIDVFITAESPLTWKCWIVKGMDQQAPQEMTEKGLGNTSETKVHEFVDKLRSTYDVAIPDYEKKPLEKFKKKEGSITGEIQTIISERSPRLMLSKLRSAIDKRELLNTYNSYSKGFVFPEKYIVYFLHFQPERTTLPEGRDFVQQWLAIRSLSEALPDNWTLVVKEHPSTFRNHFSKKVRDLHFYKSIHKLPNVVIAPLRLTPFELVDRTVAVATCTGTVGIEASIRGKPVLVFGAAQYRGLKGVFEVHTIEKIRNTIRHLNTNHHLPTESELMDYLHWVDKHSFEMDCERYFSINALRYAMIV